jgi:hypothetical protein
MAIGVLMEVDGKVAEQYAQVQSRIVEGGRLNRLSDCPVEGLLFHAAGPTPTGFRVFDVWDSEESFQRFERILMPAMREAGLPNLVPDVFPLHSLVRE